MFCSLERENLTDLYYKICFTDINC